MHSSPSPSSTASSTASPRSRASSSVRFDATSAGARLSSPTSRSPDAQRRPSSVTSHGLPLLRLCALPCSLLRAVIVTSFSPLFPRTDKLSRAAAATDPLSTGRRSPPPTPHPQLSCRSAIYRPSLPATYSPPTSNLLPSPHLPVVRSLSFATITAKSLLPPPPPSPPSTDQRVGVGTAQGCHCCWAR